MMKEYLKINLKRVEEIINQTFKDENKYREKLIKKINLSKSNFNLKSIDDINIDTFRQLKKYFVDSVLLEYKNIYEKNELYLTEEYFNIKYDKNDNISYISLKNLKTTEPEMSVETEAVLKHETVLEIETSVEPKTSVEPDIILLGISLSNELDKEIANQILLQIMNIKIRFVEKESVAATILLKGQAKVNRLTTHTYLHNNDYYISLPYNIFNQGYKKIKININNGILSFVDVLEYGYEKETIQSAEPKMYIDENDKYIVFKLYNSSISNELNKKSYKIILIYSKKKQCFQSLNGETTKKNIFMHQNKYNESFISKTLTRKEKITFRTLPHLHIDSIINMFRDYNISIFTFRKIYQFLKKYNNNINFKEVVNGKNNTELFYKLLKHNKYNTEWKYWLHNCDLNNTKFINKGYDDLNINKITKYIGFPDKQIIHRNLFENIKTINFNFLKLFNFIKDENYLKELILKSTTINSFIIYEKYNANDKYIVDKLKEFFMLLYNEKGYKTMFYVLDIISKSEDRYNSSHLKDTLNMVDLIFKKGKESFEHIEWRKATNLRTLHDDVTSIYNLVKVDLKTFNYNDKVKQLNQIINEQYYLELPANNRELIKIGQDQRHCVGSYANKILDNKCLIVVMKDRANNEILCTGELKEGSNNNFSCIQLQAKHNKKVEDIIQDNFFSLVNQVIKVI